VWVELKRPGEKATAGQKREHESMREFGQIVLVLDSKKAIDLEFPEGGVCRFD
jgi:hypothetical protein